MNRTQKQIIVKERNEMKTSQQLAMLHIKHQLPMKEVCMDGITHNQLTTNGKIIAWLDKAEEQRVKELPYVIAIKDIID